MVSEVLAQGSSVIKTDEYTSRVKEQGKPHLLSEPLTSLNFRPRKKSVAVEILNVHLQPIRD